jgi:hypothetical protein
MWAFHAETISPENDCGVQQNGSALGAPTAPSGKQTGWIRNFCTISQILPLSAGAYTLSFKLAAIIPPGQSEQILVQTEGTSQSYTPTSTFNEFTLSFEDQTIRTHTLSFTGCSGGSCSAENAVFFIDDVSLRGPYPVVTGWPFDLYPDKKIVISGFGFGNQPGKISIEFPSPSLVDFQESSSNQTSLSNKVLVLDAEHDGWTENKITSTQIDSASLVGAVNSQVVNMRIITAKGVGHDALPSQVMKLKFHNDAVITKGGPSTIGPSSLVHLQGWDFEDPRNEQPGMLNVHFTNGSFPPSSQSDLNVPIIFWKPSAIEAKMPPVTGAVEQKVEFTITTRDGRKSNKWTANFIPKMETKQLTPNDVTLVSCSNQGDMNVCFAKNASSDNGNCITDPVTIPIISFGGDHTGCFGGDTDDGTDIYSASVTNTWTIENYTFTPELATDPSWVDNGSVSSSISPPPPPPGPWSSITINVPWQIGKTGGYVNYQGTIVVKGPIGVPYN